MTDERARPQLAPAENEGGEGRPFLATLIAAVILMIVVGGARTRGDDLSGGLPELLGHVMAGGFFGAIAWSIAHAATIKHASNAWRTGSLIFLIIVGMLCELASLGGHAANRRSDARDTARQLRQMLDGDTVPDRVAAAGNGPMSRMIATWLNHVLADRRAFDHDLDASGFAQVVSLEGLTRTSPVLRRCGDFEPLAAHARTSGTDGWVQGMATARKSEMPPSQRER